MPATLDEITQAIQSGAIEALNQLVAKNGIEARLNSFGRKALHVAGKSGSPQVVSALIALGADVNAVDDDGATPLMVAAMSGNLPAISTLLTAGARPNEVQRGGKSALHFAASKPFKDIIQLLLDSKANTNILDKDGKGWIDYFNASGNTAPPRARTTVEAFSGLVEAISQTPYRERIANERMAQMDAGLENTLGNPAALRPQMRATQDSKKDSVEPLDPKTMTKDELLKQLKELGFDNLTEMAATDPYAGRNDETAKVLSMLDKKQNVMLIGGPGSGKSSLSMQVAGELGKKGQILLQLPSKLVRGNKYAGSVNENMQKWMPLALELYPEVIIFIDEAHILSTGKTSSDSTDTPMQILKEYLDDSGEKRIQIVGATTPKEQKMLEDDEAFSRRFTDIKLEPLSLSAITSVLKDPNTIARFKKWGYDVDDQNTEAWDSLVEKTCNMLDEHIFNQTFPKKAFEFLKSLLKDQSASSVTHEKLEESFSKYWSVPFEVIRGEISETSPYLSLDTEIGQRVLGQESVAAKIQASLLSDIMLKGGGHKTPASFMMMGPTGVGKTETSELLSKMLKLPILKCNMGEYKTLSDTQRLMELLSEFVVNNYSGIILFDELEKANQQVLDIMLNLLDKGSLGSGDEEVKCGNHIVIATTNIAASESMLLKKALDKEFGPSGRNIDEDWLREKLVDNGLRPELVNRFGKVVDFNYIDLPTAIKIGQLMFNGKCKQLMEDKGILVKFETEWIKRRVTENYDETFGARSVSRLVTESFEKVLSNRETLLGMKRGAEITVCIPQNGGEAIIQVKSPNGNTKEAKIDGDTLSDRQRLDTVMNILREKAVAYEQGVKKLSPHHQDRPTPPPSTPTKKP